MGMIVSVLRTAGNYDYTNRGVSSQYDHLCVMNVSGPFQPRHPDTGDITAYPVILEKGPMNTVRLVPAALDSLFENDDLEPTGEWTMMGGNYAATSDSRFAQAIETILGHSFYGAVAIHDRVE